MAGVPNGNEFPVIDPSISDRRLLSIVADFTESDVRDFRNVALSLDREEEALITLLEEDLDTELPLLMV